jgi:predicted nucleotidyltransferase
MKENVSGTASVLFSNTRRVLLGLLLTHADESFYVRQLSRITGIQMGSLQHELKELLRGGIIVRSARGHQVYYQANRESPVFGDLRGIIVKTAGVADALRMGLSPLSDRISVAFVYGSFARGEERLGSDVDVMVVGDLTFGDVVSALSPAQDQIGREINPTVYPVQEFRSKMATDHFIKTVLEGPRFFVIGDEHELERLAR